MTLPKDERKERIENDTGEATDTVYTKFDEDGIRAYHDHPFCERFNGERTDNTQRHIAKEKGHYPCKLCILGFKNRGGGGKSNLELMIENGEIDQEHIGVDWD